MHPRALTKLFSLAMTTLCLAGSLALARPAEAETSWVMNADKGTVRVVECAKIGAPEVPKGINTTPEKLSKMGIIGVYRTCKGFEIETHGTHKHPTRYYDEPSALGDNAGGITDNVLSLVPARPAEETASSLPATAP